MDKEKINDWKDEEFCEVKISVSVREKKGLKDLASSLNMTMSALVVMMVGDVIKDKPVLDKNHHRRGKRGKSNCHQKSENIRVYMPRDYRDKIIKSLESCKYEYYVSEFVRECIEKQLPEFSAFFSVEDDEGVKMKGGTLKEYIRAKADLLGVSVKQLEHFYLGKHINQMIEQSRYEELTWIEPKMIREIYGLPEKQESSKNKE